MKTPTRLLFGVRTTGTVSLIITASRQLPPQVPDLRICTSGQDVAIPCSNSTWVATLDAGDHVVHLRAPNDDSLDGPLTVTLSTPATIVGAANPSGAPLVSWTATIGTSSDPKNPLPPPATGSLDLALLADSEWLRSTLTTYDMQAVVERSA
ncbi:MAG TPA: hypothetical protein VHT91_45535 [Kofleriaceae bacterium]|jgi:hypothetical protein|nr:hypothetical protein [Kofleriaceae bacterium]